MKMFSGYDRNVRPNFDCEYVCFDLTNKYKMTIVLLPLVFMFQHKP